MSRPPKKGSVEWCADQIREIRRQKENRECMDCGEKGPQYVVSDFCTFVCMTCSGIHREFGHRVKSINVSNFNETEVDGLRDGGNNVARKYWLGRFKEDDFSVPDPNQPPVVRQNKIRKFMRLKYVEKRWVKDKKKKKKDRDKEDKDQKKSNSKKKNKKGGSKRATSSTPPIRPITDILPDIDKLVVKEVSSEASSDSDEPSPPARKKKVKKKKARKKVKKQPEPESDSDSSSAEKSSSDDSEDEPIPKARKRKKKKKKTGSKNSKSIKLPQRDSDSDNPPTKKKNKKKISRSNKGKTKDQPSPSEDLKPQKPSSNDANILDFGIFSETAQPNQVQKSPAKTAPDDEWADFATADSVAPDTEVASTQPEKVVKEDSASDSWMDSFGPPQSAPKQDIVQAMNQGFGSFAGYASPTNYGQPQQGSSTIYGQPPHGNNNMFPTNSSFFSQSNIPVMQGDMGQTMPMSFQGFQTSDETKTTKSTSETIDTNSEKASQSKDPFADLMVGTDVGEKKNTDPSPKSTEKSSGQSPPVYPFSQGVTNGGSNSGSSSQIPGGMPQMTGGMPQMTGGMPQMTGGMPQMTGGRPQMTGGMPQMTGSMPGGRPGMTGGMPQMGSNMPQMNQQQAAAMMQMYHQQHAQMQAQMYQQMYYTQQFLHQQQHNNQQQGQQQGQQLKTPQQNTSSLPKQ